MKIIIEQHLHGDYTVRKGQIVSKYQQIGTANGHPHFDSHDHTSLAEWDGTNHIHSYEKNGVRMGWYGSAPNKLINPNDLKVISTEKGHHFVFNPAKDLGGYNFLQPTPFPYYTGYNKYLHDGLDLWAPKGNKLFSMTSGIVTDVGKQSDGLTFVYIKSIMGKIEPKVGQEFIMLKSVNSFTDDAKTKLLKTKPNDVFKFVRFGTTYVKFTIGGKVRYIHKNYFTNNNFVTK